MHLLKAFKTHGTDADQQQVIQTHDLSEMQIRLVSYSLSKLPGTGKELQNLWNHKSICKNLSQDKKPNRTEVIQLGNTEAKALTDLGSICTIIKKSLANVVVLDS